MNNLNFFSSLILTYLLGVFWGTFNKSWTFFFGTSALGLVFILIMLYMNKKEKEIEE